MRFAGVGNGRRLPYCLPHDHTHADTSRWALEFLRGRSDVPKLRILWRAAFGGRNSPWGFFSVCDKTTPVLPFRSLHECPPEPSATNAAETTDSSRSGYVSSLVRDDDCHRSPSPSYR